jgi:hypothetical protein
MVNNGKFYAWAPPGWPLLLLPGILLGVPWLVNPVLGALTLPVVYRLGVSPWEIVPDEAIEAGGEGTERWSHDYSACGHRHPCLQRRADHH